MWHSALHHWEPGKFHVKPSLVSSYVTMSGLAQENHPKKGPVMWCVACGTKGTNVRLQPDYWYAMVESLDKALGPRETRPMNVGNEEPKVVPCPVDGRTSISEDELCQQLRYFPSMAIPPSERQGTASVRDHVMDSYRQGSYPLVNVMVDEACKGAKKW